ncbi:Cyclin-dependent kinase-like 4 [Durusdinium trenchii]|uniref:Cyclin-dependent kinase-like 4 n=1 Tax=Durusdinium trenchii TaxID=1381693 RepID=A0ABP0RY31_9DINO
MHKCAPLSIAADVKMADSVGFKAGVWSAEDCQTSLGISGIYEATGNALWLQTGAFAASPRDNINWASLEAFTEKFFSKRVAFKSTVTRSLSASKKQKGEKKRLIWPSVMISIVDNMKTALVESPDAGIPLSPTGQFVLWSWFLALHNAIKAADKEHLDLLWEAGLTVTLQVRFCAGDKEKCLARNLQSEAIKALGHASLSDSFVTFAVAVKTMGIDKVQAGVDLGLAYNGTVYNAAIHKASLLLASVLEDSSRAVESALFALELQYGRDILSSEYSKLSKLIAHSKSMACSWSRVHGPTSPYEFVAWLVRMLVLAFQTKLRPPAKATEQWLDKDRKTGLPGFWQAAAVVLQVFEYADKLLARLPEADADKAAKVLDELLDPCSCWDKFLRPGDKSSLPDCFHEDDVEDEEGVVIVPAGPMASVKESFNKATGMLFDLLLELVSGKHLADCQHIAAQPAGLVKALAEVQGEHADDAVELLKQLHLITTLFEGHATKSVSASTAVPAPTLLSQLTATGGSTAEADLERERAWKTVQSERRKLASFSVPRAMTKDAFLASFRGCGKVFAHGGVLNTSHRLFVASADLLVEQGEEPWAMASVPPQALWKEMVGFMAATASGPADFIMAFDGRMREVRRVPLSARKVETAATRCPVQRNRIKATRKEAFNATGEESTYQGTYTGVEYRSINEMPLIAKDDKLKILDPKRVLSPPTLPDEWDEKNGQDVPLYWQESKPIALWIALLDDWKVQAIMDLSPGSGALCEAALTRGHSKEHLQWLQAIADRAACGLMAVEGSSLFSEETAQSVKKCFPDILASLAKGKDDEDSDPLEPGSPIE